MPARLALIGGEEFSAGFEDVHAELAASCGPRCRVVYLPTCAADDGPDVVAHWSALAREKLGLFGGAVETPPVVDPASADDPWHAQLVAEADWIYLGGGYPQVAMRILSGSRVLQALLSAVRRGALVSGASGGAMLMAGQAWVMTPELAEEVGRYWDMGTPPDWNPPVAQLIGGLDLVPRSVVAPHFNRIYSPYWAGEGRLPDGYGIIGVDEQTALANLRGAWQVLGRGTVTVMRPGVDAVRYRAGETVRLEEMLCWACPPARVGVAA